MNKILTFVFLFFCTSMTSVSAETCSSLKDLEALLGEWQEVSKVGTTKEAWRKVSEMSYEGSGTTFNLSMIKQTSEALRLVEMSGEIFYIAKVAQNELPTAFKLTECGQHHFTFENSSHDFPKKIIYSFENFNKMKVDVNGAAGNGFQLNFKRKNP